MFGLSFFDLFVLFVIVGVPIAWMTIKQARGKSNILNPLER
jgi:hypothetical protein